jgi:hypothetical protein
VKLVEPPSCGFASTIIFIGKNSRGNWVAQAQNGLYGGLFVNRAQAFKYALSENGHHPETIVELSRVIELDLNGALRASNPPLHARARQVARKDQQPSFRRERWFSLTPLQTESRFSTP